MSVTTSHGRLPVPPWLFATLLRDWSARSRPPLRTAPGLAPGFHVMTDEAVEQVILDEAGRSIRWVIRRAAIVSVARLSQPHWQWIRPEVAALPMA